MVRYVLCLLYISLDSENFISIAIYIKYSDISGSYDHDCKKIFTLYFFSDGILL